MVTIKLAMVDYLGARLGLINIEGLINMEGVLYE